MPFRLVTATANITRIPIRHVQAPKDTSEARLRAPEAFAGEEGDVHARLQFDRNVIIDLDATFTERISLEAIQLSLAYRFGEAVATVRQIIFPEPRPVPTRIQLKMDSSDLRAIFRAMPDGGGLAIRW